MPSLSTFHFSSSPSPVHPQQAAPSTSTPSYTRDFLTTSAGDSTCPHKPPQLLRQVRALVALLQLPVQDDAASPPPCCTHAGTSHSLVGLFDRSRFHFMNSHVFIQPATLHLSSKKQVSPATRMPIADDSNIPTLPVVPERRIHLFRPTSGRHTSRDQLQRHPNHNRAHYSPNNTHQESTWTPLTFSYWPA